jgi:hypothetical protein
MELEVLNFEVLNLCQEADKLTDAQLHVLASYVWSLSNTSARVAAK